MKRNLLRQVWRPFDDPKVKQLGRNQQPVLVAEFAPNFASLIPRETGHNAVHQRVEKVIGAAHPVGELVAQTPGFTVLEDKAAQLVAVAVNQFARKKDQPLGWIAPHGLKPLEEQRSHFGGKRLRALAGLAGLADKRNASLSGVGDHESKRRTA